MVSYVSFDISSHSLRPRLDALKPRSIQHGCIDVAK